MKLVDCTLEQHGAAILEILNEIIVNSTAVYDYVPRPLSSMTAWFETKAAANYPVMGAEASDGTLLGYATYGSFRAWPGYKYTVEHSVHLHHDARGRGVGSALLAKLIETAEERDVHVMIAGIDATNAASVALHRKHGFEQAGTVRECGFKFGKWLDLALYQRVLGTPVRPEDG